MRSRTRHGLTEGPHCPVADVTSASPRDLGNAAPVRGGHPVARLLTRQGHGVFGVISIPQGLVSIPPVEQSRFGAGVSPAS